MRLKMSSAFTFTFPGRIVFGTGTAKTLGTALSGFGKILLVCGSHAEKSGAAAEICSILSGHEIRTVSGINAEPPLEDVDRIIMAGREFNPGCVVAIGGGSVIDAAKAAAALIPVEGLCADYFSDAKEITGKGLFFAALPTSSGTGAEITNNSVLTDAATKIKKSLRHPQMTADLAICDPLLTVSCPRGVTAASGLDAFIQALESCTSPKACAATKALSYTAVGKIFNSLKKACDNGSDIEARSDMAEGSLISAMAFSQTGLGAIHGLAHPIGSLLKVPHGTSCAVLMPYILEWNMETCRKDYAYLAGACGTSGAEGFVKAACGLARELGIKSNFKDYGLSEKHFDFIVKNCRSASMKLNPRQMSDSDIVKLLECLM